MRADSADDAGGALSPGSWGCAERRVRRQQTASAILANGDAAAPLTAPGARARDSRAFVHFGDSRARVSVHTVHKPARLAGLPHLHPEFYHAPQRYGAFARSTSSSCSYGASQKWRNLIRADRIGLAQRGK